MNAAAQKGAAAAIIITAGLGHGPGSVSDACQKAARAKGLRLVGPNCLGVMAPRAKLNATFAARMTAPGDLALISQSGGIAAGMIEWATERAIGFSAIASIGDKIDVDFGDLLDFFALDSHTRAILLYIEAINDARKFMSAARAAARTKPVVVVKAGRHAQGARAAATHTGALAGADDVYDAAFRRAGLLRVLDLAELFSAAETLGHLKGPVGNRLAILTNGGGVGVLAIDRLVGLQAARRHGFRRPHRSGSMHCCRRPGQRMNPVDIVGDADAARYTGALEALLDDPANDARAGHECPDGAGISGRYRDVGQRRRANAQRVIPRSKPVLAAWIGTSEATSAIFNRADLPSYATESDAVRGFMHVVRHGESLRTLMATPPSLPLQFAPDVSAARRAIENAIVTGRSWLDPIELAALLGSLRHRDRPDCTRGKS